MHNPDELWERLGKYLDAHFNAVMTQFFPQFRAFVREDRDGEQSRVPGSGAADGESPNRNAGRHLHGGKQRIEALKRRRFPLVRPALAAACARRRLLPSAPRRQQRR